MQILDLLGMYFDAVVVEVEKYLHFFQIGSGHTVDYKIDTMKNYALMRLTTAAEGLKFFVWLCEATLWK